MKIFPNTLYALVRSSAKSVDSGLANHNPMFESTLQVLCSHIAYCVFSAVLCSAHLCLYDLCCDILTVFLTVLMLDDMHTFYWNNNLTTNACARARIRCPGHCCTHTRARTQRVRRVGAQRRRVLDGGHSGGGKSLHSSCRFRECSRVWFVCVCTAQHSRDNVDDTPNAHKHTHLAK